MWKMEYRRMVATESSRLSSRADTSQSNQSLVVSTEFMELTTVKSTAGAGNAPDVSPIITSATEGGRWGQIWVSPQFKRPSCTIRLRQSL